MREPTVSGRACQPRPAALCLKDDVQKDAPDYQPDFRFSTNLERERLLADCGFSKQSRLRNAADYKAVFNNVRFKVSCRHFLILAVAGTPAGSRLGLGVAKKHIADANQRNRIKRVIRESYRHSKERLAGLDLVVLVRKDADKLPNCELFEKLDALWTDLQKKAHRPGGS